MQFVEAYTALGYELPNPLQSWSAINGDGVCISIWQKEIRAANGLPYCDMWELHPGDTSPSWAVSVGNRKRIDHLKQSIEHFGGKVDVVLLSGEPGQGYGSAEPWDAAKRGGYWQISRFDPVNGFFRAEVTRSPTAKPLS